MRTASALAWALLPSLLWAAPAAPDKDDKPVEKVRQALDQPISIQIDKLTLADAVNWLSKKTKVSIVLDSVAIQQQLGFTPDQSNILVQLDLKDVKTRTALRTILAPYNLSFAVIGDTIIVTTEDVAALRQMRQRISVDLSKVELAAALRQIGRDTATNLVLDARAEKEAKAEVTLQLEDVPLETAVRLLAEMAGLKPVRVGNTLFVTRKELAAEMRYDPDFAQPNPPPSIAGYSTTFGQPISVINGQVFANPAGGTAVVPVPAPNPPFNGPAPAPPAVVPGPGTGATAPALPNPKLGEQDAPKDSVPAPADKKDDK